MFMGVSLFRLGKFSSIILLKIFNGTLWWESLLFSIPVILRFGLHILSWISWVFWVRTFLHFALFLTVVSMFSMVSSVPEFSILSLVFCWRCLHLCLLGFLSPGSSLFVSFYSVFPFLDLDGICSIPSPVWLCFL